MNKRSQNGKIAQKFVYNHIIEKLPYCNVIINHINSNKTDIVINCHDMTIRVEVKSCQVNVGIKTIRLGRFFITPKEIYQNDVFAFVYSKKIYFVNSNYLKQYYYNKSENITRYCISIVAICKFLFYDNIIDYVNKYYKILKKTIKNKKGG